MGVFWGAFLAPIFAILLFNTIIFVAVVVVLMRHTRNTLGRMKEQVNLKTTVRLLLGISGTMSLFGLTWFFAALTVKEASTAFQFLFAIFNSLQGFFIFVFFCVLSKDARELWKEVLSHGRFVSTFHPSHKIVSSSGTTPRFKPQTTTPGTGLATSSITALTSEFVSSATHAPSHSDIHLTQSETKLPEKSHVIEKQEEERYTSTLPVVAETKLLGQENAGGSDGIFFTPLACETELSDSMGDKTECGQNLQHSQEATHCASYHERETAEVDPGLSGGSDEESEGRKIRGVIV